MNKQPEVTNATRQKFIDAFWEIFMTKSIDKISIKEITTLSGYNRSTFYNYFVDIYDLLKQAENELIDTISSALSSELDKLTNDGNIELVDLESVYKIISPIFLANEDKLYALLGSNGDPSFQNFLAEKLITNLVKVNIIPEDTKNREYIWTFLYSSMFNLLTVWRKNDHDLSEEEFVKMMFTLASKGLEGYAMFQAGNNEKSR